MSRREIFWTQYNFAFIAKYNQRGCYKSSEGLMHHHHCHCWQFKKKVIWKLKMDALSLLSACVLDRNNPLHLYFTQLKVCSSTCTVWLPNHFSNSLPLIDLSFLVNFTLQQDIVLHCGKLLLYESKFGEYTLMIPFNANLSK